MASRDTTQPFQDEQAIELQRGDELQTSSAMATAQAEIQSAFIMARRFPRNEEKAFQGLLRACDRASLAKRATYNFKRGRRKNEYGDWVDNFVNGPSVYLAREAARVWGNLRSGMTVLRDDKHHRLIRGWAIDLETNNYIHADDEVEKLVQTKNGWEVPDERALRELTNKRGAMLVRNCLLQLMPRDFIEDAQMRAGETLTNEVKKDPDAWKKIVMSFAELNVTAEALALFLGHGVQTASPAELVKLRQIYVSIKEGNSSWTDYVEVDAAASIGTKTSESIAKLKERLRKAGAFNVAGSPAAGQGTGAPPNDVAPSSEPLPPEEQAKVDARRAELAKQAEELKRQREQRPEEPSDQDLEPEKALLPLEPEGVQVDFGKPQRKRRGSFE